jgi:hypothetical protein
VNSATSPNPAKVSQNIFFCMSPAYCELRAVPSGVPNRYLAHAKIKKRSAMCESRPALQTFTAISES